jgi:hypothetical protein
MVRRRRGGVKLDVESAKATFDLERRYATK